LKAKIFQADRCVSHTQHIFELQSLAGTSQLALPIMLVLKSSVDECPPKTSPLLPNASVHVGQPQQQSQPDELDDLEDILSQPQPSARARLSESWASDPEVVLLADRPWEEVQKTAFALEEFKRRAAELGKLFLNPMSYTVAASASLGVAAGALVGGPCGALYGGVLGVKGGAAAAVAGAALHNASRELLHGLGGAPRPGTPPGVCGSRLLISSLLSTLMPPAT